MKKHPSFDYKGQATWVSNAVQFSHKVTKHFGPKKIGYQNSLTDLGYVEQLSLYEGILKHRHTERKIYVVVVEIVAQEYEQHKFKACVVVARKGKYIKYVRWTEYEQVPMACVNASIPGIQGELRQYIDSDQLLIDPKHLVSVCLHHFDEVWGRG